jgi:hypothetical protein
MSTGNTKLPIIGAVLSLLLCSFGVEAQELSSPPGIPDLFVAPTYDGDLGLFHLPVAYVLPRGSVAVSFFRDDFARDPGKLDIATLGVSTGIGITRWFELFGNAGLQARVDADRLRSGQFYNDNPFLFSASRGNQTFWAAGFGDLNVGGKFLVYQSLSGASALSVRAALKIPTASSSGGIGTGKLSFSGGAVFSHVVTCKALLSGSVVFRENASPRGLSLADAVDWGIGAVALPCRTVQPQVELSGAIFHDGHVPGAVNPVDIMLGAAVNLGERFFIRPAISSNLNSGRWGLQISLGLRPRLVFPRPRPALPLPLPAPIIEISPVPLKVKAGAVVPIAFSITNPYQSEVSWQATLVEDPRANGSINPSAGGPFPWHPGVVSLASIAISYSTVGATKAQILIEIFDKRGIIDSRLISLKVE